MERLSQETYGGLLDLIYQTALEPRAWESVMLELANLTGCVAGGLTIENAVTGRGYPITFFGFDPDHVEKTFDHFLPQNPLHAISDRMQPGCVVTNEMAVSLDVFQKSDFYNGWARPQGLCCAVTVVLERTSATYAPLTLVRPDGAGDVDEESYELLARLAPHLMRAVRLSSQFRNLETQSDMLASALSHLNTAVLVLDEQKRVGFANEAAERLMESRTVVYVDGSRTISAVGRASNDALQVALDAVISGIVTATDVRLLTQSGFPADATILSVPESQASLVPSEREASCVLMVRELQNDDDLAIARKVGRLFDLTPAEERILSAVLNGTGLTPAAMRFGIGRETARTHLYNIFRKTGTHTQGELIGLAGRLMPSVGGNEVIPTR